MYPLRRGNRFEGRVYVLHLHGVKPSFQPGNFQLYCLDCPLPWVLSGSRSLTSHEATVGLGLPLWPAALWLASLRHGSGEVALELCPNLVGSYLALLCSPGLRPRLCCSQWKLWLICRWAAGWKFGRHCSIECLAHSGFLVSGHSFVDNPEILSCLSLQTFLEPNSRGTE